MREESSEDPERHVDLSVVVAVLDEEESIRPLYSGLDQVLDSLGREYEIIFIDDGSEDSSFQILKSLYENDREHVRVIQFRRNFGKTAALAAGFRETRGEVVITMDADLQDDPTEIPGLLDKLNEDYDLVVAWRHERRDPLSKRLPSKVANAAVSLLTGVKIHDLNCGFKAYRREVVADLKLYGELHRFVPVLAHWRGYRVTEQKVVHRPRQYGQSKYGFERLGRSFLDFGMVLFLTYYLKRPMHLFGTLGALLFLFGFAIGLYLTGLWVLGEGIGWRPLLFLGILAMIVGVQMASIGLLGEMVRNFAYDPEEEYSIRRLLS
ncbi:MAG TPA: glycosyltransferase family 2 protein [Anaerolineae bacterium]|nr:glycosyltransferase family 2 protein [Anaerolineae bacterium]